MTTAAQRRFTVRGGLTAATRADWGEWTETNDLEITSDPEKDRPGYNQAQTVLAAQAEQSDIEVTRTFLLPRDRTLMKTIVAVHKAGGGSVQANDQYLEESGAAFDLPIVYDNGRIIGSTRSGVNINDGNGRATLQLTLRFGALPTA